MSTSDNGKSHFANDQLPPEPKDNLSTWQKLALLTGAEKYEQNWSSISRSLAKFGEKDEPSNSRPTPQSCASNYLNLIEANQAPKKSEKSIRDNIVKNLKLSMKAELEDGIEATINQFCQKKIQLDELKSKNCDSETFQKMCKEVYKKEQLKRAQKMSAEDYHSSSSTDEAVHPATVSSKPGTSSTMEKIVITKKRAHAKYDDKSNFAGIVKSDKISGNLIDSIGIDKTLHGQPVTTMIAGPSFTNHASSIDEESIKFKKFANRVIKELQGDYNSKRLTPSHADIYKTYTKSVSMQLDLPMIKKRVDTGQVKNKEELKRDLMIVFCNMSMMYQETDPNYKKITALWQTVLDLLEPDGPKTKRERAQNNPEVDCFCCIGG